MSYKYSLLIVITLFCNSNIKSQNKNYETLFTQNKFDRIIQLADSNITIGSNSSQDYFWKSNALNNKGKYIQSINNLESALKLFPNDSIIKKFLVNIYFDNGMYFKAKPVINELLLKDSTNFNLISKKILIYEFNNKYNDALSLLKKQIKKDTTNTFLMLHLADNYYKTDSIKKSLFYYDKAYKQNPDNIKLAYKIAKIYLKTDTKKALPICDSILKKDAKNLPFIKVKAYALKKLDRNKRALKLFKNLNSLGDSSFSTLKYIGILSYKTNDFHNAIPIMKTAMAIDSSDVDLTFYYGCTLASDSIYYKKVKGKTLKIIRCKLPDNSISKNKQEACFYINKSIDLLAPPTTLSIIYYRLGVIYGDLKQYKKALNYYQLAFKNNSKKLDILFIIASIYEIHFYDKETALKKYKQFVTKVNETHFHSYYFDLANNRIKHLKEDIFFKGDLK